MQVTYWRDDPGKIQCGKEEVKLGRDGTNAECVNVYVSGQLGTPKNYKHTSGWSHQKVKEAGVFTVNCHLSFETQEAHSLPRTSGLTEELNAPVASEDMQAEAQG